MVTDVTLKMFPITEHRLYETVSFETIEAGLTAVRRIMRLGLRPFLVRLYDRDEARHLMRGEEAPGNILLIGFEGLEEVARPNTLQESTFADPKVENTWSDPALAWMERRFDFSTVENLLEQPGGFAETIEVAHFWDGILRTYNELKEVLAPLSTEVLGHFSHVYLQGTSLYMILLGKVEDDAAAEERLMQIWDVAMNTCLERGAAISHHHGVGLARLPYIWELGTSKLVLRRIKGALDPAGVLNPGKYGLNRER